ncbi:ACR3 family arsenite efflux pump ArsB [Desmospora profundinema]|uniref:ACR3 family arsenite efflux pump ArsB n=1 Tax=Desmospora profundinema TaxID=1571184 RepID=A0ABU1ILU7_9BACL|nr:ACR3 family arsenite efflux pump ArsB [Desmospora profundinema]
MNSLGWLERSQALVILCSVVLGLWVGRMGIGSDWAERLILPFLVVMLIGVFLQIPLGDVRKSLANVPFTTASVGINFVVTPLFAGGLGYLFLRESPELWIGFVMLMVTPCTDWYLVFTSIARGNVTLSAAILPLNLILQILLLPFYVWFLTGQLHGVEPMWLLTSIVLVLVVPLVLSRLIRWIFRRCRGEDWLREKVLTRAGTVQLIFLNLVIVAMFASQGMVLLQNPWVLFTLLLPVWIGFMLIFAAGQGVARVWRFSYADTVSLHFTTLARNSPIALAIAITAFPDQPLIALALVMGPLIELPTLSLFSSLLLRIRGK